MNNTPRFLWSFCVWLALPGLLALSVHAEEEPRYARAFIGAVNLSNDRVLAWEHVADGSGEQRLWVFAPESGPVEIGRLAGDSITAAASADTVVFVTDQKIFATSAERPGTPEAVALDGAWLSVAHGPKGFIAGGWADAVAVSPDGRTWTRTEFKAPGEGGIAQLAVGGPGVAALRQTSVMQEGWGVNVSEVCVLEDGKPWRRIAHFEGGNNDFPLGSLQWFGDRWVGIGFGVFTTVMPGGQSERIDPGLDQTEFGPIGGETRLFREENRWLMIHDGWLLESADLATWTKRAPLSGNDWQGAWLADRNGAPLLVGSVKRDWTAKQVFTLAALLNPPTAPKPAVVDNVARAASPKDVAAGLAMMEEAMGAKTVAEAQAWAKSVNEQNASLEKGRQAKAAGKIDEAIAAWTAGAEQGDVRSMYELSRHFLAKGELSTAESWAKKGHAKAVKDGSVVLRIGGDDLLDDIDDASYELEESTLPKPGTKKNALSKGSPWTAGEVIAALKRGEKNYEIGEVIGLAFDGSAIDTPGYFEIHTSQEGRELYRDKTGPLFQQTLSMALTKATRARSVATEELAREKIARRRAELPARPKPVDTPELRARHARGEAAAAYELFLILLDQVQAPQTVPTTLRPTREEVMAWREAYQVASWPASAPTREELIARATAGGFAPAQWLVAEQIKNAAGSDTTKDDSLRRLALLRTAAEAGDAHGAFHLAKLYSFRGSLDQAADRNHAEAEYWFTEAGARGWSGQMESRENCAWLELANLYSGLLPIGRSPLLLPGSEDATYRWARNLQHRGGVLARTGELLLAYYRIHSTGELGGSRDIDAFLASLPEEIPLYDAAELTRMEEAAAARDVKALLKLAGAYAQGRGVRQNDMKAVDYYRQAADAGAGLPAYRALIHHYKNGFGVNKDPGQLLAWMTKAAETGDVASLRELGDAQHFAHRGTPTNYPAALAAYEKAAALGDAEALFSIGLMHRHARGLPKDEAKWREFTERAATKGYVPAMRAIAESYNGNLVKSDANSHAQAALWYQKAVDAGDKRSRLDLAMALQGMNDKAGAEKWFLTVAADDAKHVQSRYYLAQLAQWSGRRDEAARWYREIAPLETIYDFMKEGAARFVREYDEEEAAKPGTLLHYRKLAKTGTPDDMYDYAVRVVATNQAEGMNWLGGAAREGHALATAVYYGEQGKTDKAGTDKWVRELAEKGNSQAMLIVGLLTAATDKPAGLALMEKAAAAGNLDAKLRLGMMQYQGNELPQDRAAGIARITEAADGGYALAQFTLGKALIAGDASLPAEPKRGLELLMRAMTQNRELPAALQAAVLLGQIHEQGKVPGIAQDLGAAVEAFKRATEIDPKNAQLRTHYNDVHRRMTQTMKGMK